MSEWTVGAVFDAIADVVPDRLMTVCGDRRSTFAESAQRTSRLANFFNANGFGVHRERETLNRWECGQDRVALIMYNDLYPDAVIGCLKARAVPVNVNHHYSPGEIRDLLDYLAPRGIIYHRSLGARFAEVLPPSGTELLISVDDGNAVPELPGAISLDDILATTIGERPAVGSPDDLIMMCTGGTTGRPKGVLWRQSDMYVASMVGADHASVTEIHDKVRGGGSPWFAVSPLMHAAGMWTAFAALCAGLPVVLYDDRNKLDVRSVWETAEREKVGMMTMVGDAYAGPLIAELRAQPYDLSVAELDRHRRSRHQREIQTGADGIPAARHDHRRLWVFGDRQYGVRAQPQRTRQRDVPTEGWCGGRLGRPHPVPAARRKGDRLGGQDRPDSAGVLQRCRSHPTDLPADRRPARGDTRRPGIRRSRTAPSACSVATRWS